MVVFTWNPAGGNYAATVKDGAISLRTVADFHLLNLEALEELDKLDCEIYEEIQIKSLLKSCCHELAVAIEELERRLEDIENEGSEWKTRYHNQNEVNQMLERQIVILANQIEDTKLLLKEGTVSKAFSDVTDSSIQKNIRIAQKEKMHLETEMREIEQRIEQEAKAFHKANEERRQLLNELNSNKQAVMQKHQKSQLDILQTDLKRLGQLSTKAQATPHAMVAASFSRSNNNKTNHTAARSNVAVSNNAHKQGSECNNTLAPNQRILDPRKGPIRKAAAAKKLPALASSSASSY